MAKSDFLPARDSEQETWMNNFETKSISAAQLLGIAQEDITAMHTLIQARQSAYLAQNIKREEAKAATKTYETTKKIANAGIRAVVRRFKASPTYSAALGAELGIIGANVNTSKTALQKPVLKVSLKGGKIVIAFVKGQSDGIRLFSRRGTETGFTFLDVKMSSPYQDDRPNLVAGQPELRQYQAFFTKRDLLVGEVSDTVSITLS
jgi:hypothetical protein